MSKGETKLAAKEEENDRNTQQLAVVRTCWWRGRGRSRACCRYTAHTTASPDWRTWGRAKSTAAMSSGHRGAGYGSLNKSSEENTEQSKHIKSPMKCRWWWWSQLSIHLFFKLRCNYYSCILFQNSRSLEDNDGCRTSHLLCLYDQNAQQRDLERRNKGKSNRSIHD